MGKYKKEIKHCEKCNKHFSVFPNSTETLCTRCKRNNLDETLYRNGYAPQHTLVRSPYGSIKESFAVEDAARRAFWDESTSIERTCRDCGKVFEISRAERIFFEYHNIVDTTSFRCFYLFLYYIFYNIFYFLNSLVLNYKT